MDASNSDSEEEILIYAEFQNSVNIEAYRNVHVLGVTEKNPIIQTDETFFAGEFKNPLGTYMFFEDDPSPESMDPLFDQLPEKNLKYVTKTRKLLYMEHAYVTPKEGSEQKVEDKPQENNGIEVVKFNTVQDALNIFKSEIQKELDKHTQGSTECVQSSQTDKHTQGSTECVQSSQTTN